MDNVNANVIKEQLTIAQRDLKLREIEDIIKEKKRMLLQRRKVLRNKEMLNVYLFDVRKDYESYFNYIKEQKQKQYNLMLSYKMTMDGIEQMDDKITMANAKLYNDNKEISEQIADIKADLDEIIK